MTVDDFIREARSLPIADRKRLIMAVVDSLTGDAETNTHQYNILDFEGVGSHLRDIDAQQYIDNLRDEWDHRPCD